MTYDPNPAAEERYTRNVRTVVDKLRRLADQVEREGLSTGLEDALSARRSGENAGNVVHAIAWGVANLNVDLVIAAANDWRTLSEDALRAEQ